jgi:predicted RNA-binding Zn ribbon-like protein
MDALALANSFRDHRGRVRDDLDPALGLHGLRQVVRDLFAAAVNGARPAADGVAALNDLARTPSLEWRGRGPRLAAEEPAAEAARTAIELLASGRLRQCGNPRCILYFLAEGRREFCSDTCANRTRVARHAHAGRQPRA